MSDFDFEASDNRADLLALAKELNLNIDARLSIDRIKDAIRAEYKVIHSKPTVADMDSQRKVKLLIHKTEGDTGSDDVPVSVNGKTWLIKRGHEVLVPAFIVEVLKNAVREDYQFNDRDKEMVKREVPAYPYTSMSI